MNTAQERHREKMQAKAEGRWKPTLLPPPKAEPSQRIKAEGVFRAKYDAAIRAITIPTASVPLVSIHPFAQIRDLSAALKREGDGAGFMISLLLDGLIDWASEHPDQDREKEMVFI